MRFPTSHKHPHLDLARSPNEHPPQGHGTLHIYGAQAPTKPQFTEPDPDNEGYWPLIVMRMEE